MHYTFLFQYSTNSNKYAQKVVVLEIIAAYLGVRDRQFYLACHTNQLTLKLLIVENIDFERNSSIMAAQQVFFRVIAFINMTNLSRTSLIVACIIAIPAM